MIKKYFENAIVKNDFKPSGLSSLIQNVDKEDILFLNVSNVESINKLIKNSLRSDFCGLIVATKISSEIEKHNHVILSEKEYFKSQTTLIDKFYPLKDVEYYGVTGTNGKTTTCWLMSELGKLSKKSVLYMGTVGTFLNGSKISEDFVTTTPTFLDLRKTISNISEDFSVVALEISSHALAQNRLCGLKLDGAAWTNFSQDHLDYHKTMDEYFKAKNKIVEMLKPDASLYINKSEKTLFEKIKTKSKLFAAEVELDKKIALPLFFRSSFNMKNLELACELMNMKEKVNVEALSPPPGRFEFIKHNDIDFIVDYAHTPDALENVLKEIKKSYKGFYVITVVGCGGDRDKSKRPIMGDVSRRYSDLSIFTSDNPRSENPKEIIKDMISSKSDDYEIEVDRKKAIALASTVGEKREEDVIVLIAGKGHETYQEVLGVRSNFSDIEVVKSL